MTTMDDEKKITHLLRCSGDPAKAFEIALKLALSFIATPGGADDSLPEQSDTLPMP